MPHHKIAYITRSKPDISLVEQGLTGLDYEISVHFCNSIGETIEAIKGVEVIINQGVRMPGEVVEEIDKAVAIMSVAHGFDNIDHVAATNRGIMVVNCAGFVSEHVSNHTIMLLLACARKLTILHDHVRAGKWGPGTRDLSRDIPQIHGQVLGIVGLGNIGRVTARKATVFGLEVIAYDPYVQPWIAQEYNVELVPSLNELASRSDYVSVLVPLNEETTKLIDAPFFKAMKPAAYFINTCRGRTVDEQALIKALQDGKIAGAGLDVFEQEPTPTDNPLLKMDNVIVTPHFAGSSFDSLPTGDRRIGEETARVLKGIWPMSLVNPDVLSKLPPRPPATNR